MNWNGLTTAARASYRNYMGYAGTKRRGKYANTKRRGGPLTLAQVKAVQRIHDKGIPKKYVDTELLNIDTDSVPVLTKLTMPSQGSTDDDRIGDRIRVKSIQMRLSSYLSSVLSVQRYILIQWLQDDAVAAPVIGDILEDQTLGSEISLYNVNGSSKYRVLWDSMVTNKSGNSTTRYFLHKICKPKQAKIRFNEGANTGFGHFYLISMGNQGDTTDDFRAYFRIRYFDA